MMLGDYGADVIKVERPGAGDETRTWGPPFDARRESAYYLSVNRNKLSVALDLDVAGDREIVRALALDADVVVENFKRGTLDRRGLGAGDLLAANPRLVWCTISGFGEASDRPGYDFVAQAEAGWMAITGERDGAPMKVGVALADVIAGKDAAAAILATVAARAQRALPPNERHVHISLLHSATSALVNVAQNVLVSGNDARRWGNAHPNLTPYELFDAADGAVVIAVGSDAQWLACTRALGLDDLARDAALRENAGRLAQRERIVATIARCVKVLRTGDVLGRLQKVGVPCGVVKPVRAALHAVDASPLTGVAPQASGTVRFPPPKLDEHGETIRQRGWGVFRIR